MSAAEGRVRRNVRTAREALPSADILPLAADVAPFTGWLMARNEDGYGVAFSETPGLISAGRAQRDQDAGDTDGARSVLVDTMVEDIDQSTAAGDYFADADAPAVAYGIDNHTIGKKSTGRSIAGVFFGINASTGKARLWSGLAAHAMAIGLLSLASADPAAPMLRARAATTANLSATLDGIVLTADANGALAAQDGVTLAVGDKLFAKDQTAGEAKGLYVITSLGGVSSKFVLTRAAEFDEAAEAKAGLSIFVSEGTVAGNTIWDLTTDDPIDLGTDSLTFTKRPTLAEIASTSAGKGASLVGVEDANNRVTGTTVEAVLAELALGASAGTALTDADATVNVTAGKKASWRTLPAATLSTGRTLTLGTTGAIAGDTFIITRVDATANTYAIANGGAGAGTLATLPASKKNFLVAQFDGTNWALVMVGTQ